MYAEKFQVLDMFRIIFAMAFNAKIDINFPAHGQLSPLTPFAENFISISAVYIFFLFYAVYTASNHAFLHPVHLPPSF
jgi:hypothetical protein